MMSHTPSGVMNLRILLSAIVGMIAISLGGAAGAATIPVSDNFDNDSTGNSAPTSGGTTWAEDSQDAGDWTIADPTSGPNGTTGDHVYRVDYSSNTNTTTEVRSTGLSVPDHTSQDFSFRADFTINASNLENAEVARVGFRYQNTDSDLNGFPSGSGNTFFELGTGELKVVDNESGSFNAAISTNTLTVDTTGSTVYELVVNGTYLSGGDLDISATLSDGTTTLTAGQVLNAPAGGENLGFTSLMRGNEEDMTTPVTLQADYDNFSVLIPEPATLALLGLGGAVMISGRRRR